MKKLLFPICVVLILSIGCLPTSQPSSNQPPTAYIDLVSPTDVVTGVSVAFSGHGVDIDGSIVAYDWRSSLDGDLGASANFETSSLSSGTHTIWFKVQDDKGEWSNQVSATVVVVPSGVGDPVVNSFDANPGMIVPGGSSMLSWDVSGATMVSIDQGVGNVALSGTRVVLPAKTTTYNLTASNQTGSVMAAAEVVVADILPNRVDLYSIAVEDGQVRRDGYVGQEPDVGDTKSGTSIQAFLSFDISMIPEDATITSASLDLASAIAVGDPFNKLGLLYVYDHQYQTLSSRDFFIGIEPGALLSIAVQPQKHISSAALAAAVQKQVGARNTRFQLRLQFAKPYFYNNQADYLALGEGRTRIIIEYQY